MHLAKKYLLLILSAIFSFNFIHSMSDKSDKSPRYLTPIRIDIKMKQEERISPLTITIPSPSADLPSAKTKITPTSQATPQSKKTPPKKTKDTQAPNVQAKRDDEQHKMGCEHVLLGLGCPAALTCLYIFAITSLQNNSNTFNATSASLEQCTPSAQQCLNANITTDVQSLCWDAQITMNANSTHNTTIQQSCLCPMDGIDNSTALTAWALSNLLMIDANYTLGNSTALKTLWNANSTLCIRPNLKPCNITNGCSDPRQAFFQFKNAMHKHSLAKKRMPRSINHRLHQPPRGSKKQGK